MSILPLCFAKMHFLKLAVCLCIQCTVILTSMLNWVIKSQTMQIEVIALLFVLKRNYVKVGIILNREMVKARSTLQIYTFFFTLEMQ